MFPLPSLSHSVLLLLSTPTMNLALNMLSAAKKGTIEGRKEGVSDERTRTVGLGNDPSCISINQSSCGSLGVEILLRDQLFLRDGHGF